METIGEVITRLSQSRDARLETWQRRREWILAGQYRRCLDRTLYDVSGNYDEKQSIAIVCNAIASHHLGHSI